MKEPTIAKESDSMMQKSLYFLQNNKVRIREISLDKITADVEGLHSADPNDQDGYWDGKKPYVVIIRKNGEIVCSCPNFVYVSKKHHYHQFWGNAPIRLPPPCSHILAVQLTIQYRKWIIHDSIYQKYIDLAKIDPSVDVKECAERDIISIAEHIPLIRSHVHTSGIQVVPNKPVSFDNLKDDRPRRKIDLVSHLDKETDN